MRMIAPFLSGHMYNTVRRLGYSYLLRGFSVASIELGVGAGLVLTGMIFGLWHWASSIHSGIPATSGTVILAALPIIVGMQMLLSWLNFDVSAEPTLPVHILLGNRQIQS